MLADGLVPTPLKELEVYQAGKSIEELAEQRGAGKISKLASNENPLGPSPLAIREMTLGLWDCHRYPDMYGRKLKAKLAALYDLKPDNIILGNGSEGIMAYIIRTFVRPGDELLTSAHTFVGFCILAKGSGANLIQVPMNAHLQYDIEAMTRQISPKTKLIYVANPNNPTGTYINREAFDYLMKHVARETLVILDEAYFEFAQGQQDFPDSMEYRYDNVITLRTFSKAYGLSGIRLGYGFAHPDLITYLHKAKLPFEPSAMAQAAGIGALEDRHHLRHTLENNQVQKKRLELFLNHKGLARADSFTNFIAVAAADPAAASWLYDQLLNRGVIVRPLRGKGIDRYLRISIGTAEEMDHLYQAWDAIHPDYRKKFGGPRP